MRLAYIFMLIVLSQIVFSAGVSPAFRYIKFEPGKSMDMVMSIINDAEEDVRVSLSARGELAQYITFAENDFSMAELEREIHLTLALPEVLSPGMHKTDILIRLTAESGSLISAEPVVVNQLIVGVPIEGVYCDAKFSFVEPKSLYLTVYNYGAEDADAGAVVRLMNSSRVLASFPKQEGLVKSQRELVFGYSAPFVGEYEAVASIACETQNLTIREVLPFRSPSMEILRVLPSLYRVGENNRLTLVVATDWNRPVNLSWTLEMEGKAMDLPRFTIGPGEEKKIDAFFRLPNYGKYDLKFRFNLGKKVMVYDHKIVLEKEVIEEKGKDMTLYITIALIVVFIVLVGTVIALYLSIPKNGKN